MQTQSHFQLISPLIYLVFCVGFLVIWRHARDSAPVRLFALSFFAGAFATLADYLRPAMPPAVAVFATNIPYMVTVFAFTAALFHYYTERIPMKALAFTALVLLCALSWYTLVDTDIAARVVIMNFGAAGVYLSSMFALSNHIVRPIDKLLRFLIVVIAFAIAGRAVYVLWYHGAGLTEANYSTSVVAMALHFIAAIGALTVAAVLFVMVGMEIVMRLIHTSETDPLTGVLNRRGFESRIRELMDSRPPDENRVHAIIMADIDRFKRVNDQWGHEAGDKVITRFASILAGTARDGDLVVRWGGEEFLVVILNADLSLARLYAEAVRSAFGALAHDVLDDNVVTASFGIAAWSAEGTISASAELADRALYRAKREGRDRVCIADPETAIPRAGLAVA